MCCTIFYKNTSSWSNGPNVSNIQNLYVLYFENPQNNEFKHYFGRTNFVVKYHSFSRIKEKACKSQNLMFLVQKKLFCMFVLMLVCSCKKVYLTGSHSEGVSRCFNPDILVT